MACAPPPTFCCLQCVVTRTTAAVARPPAPPVPARSDSPITFLGRNLNPLENIMTRFPSSNYSVFKPVFIPSESKTLHLYEARYIALLEEAMDKRKNSFVHFVLDPVVDNSPKASFAVRYGCLVHIESVQKLEIGALVSIRGICRVNILNLSQMVPYFRGAVSPMMDEPHEDTELGTRISKLRESMCNLHRLQMKLRVPEDEPLQTNIRASLLWSENEIFEEYNEYFIPGFPERLSFAAYQTVSGMSGAELLTLQENKIQAMDLTNTLDRLNNGIKYVEHNIGMIAARLAIQNI